MTTIAIARDILDVFRLGVTRVFLDSAGESVSDLPTGTDYDGLHHNRIGNLIVFHGWIPWSWRRTWRGTASENASPGAVSDLGTVLASLDPEISH